MLVFDHKKIMFIHIQKTGGTWIGEALRQLGIEWTNIGRHHLPIHEARTKYPNYFAFTSIRNPLTWYQSYWAMKMYRSETTGNRWDHTGIKCLNRCESKDFNTFIAKTISKHPGYYTNLVNRCTDEKVYILKQEDLINDFMSLLDHLNIPYDVDKVHEVRPREVNASLHEYQPQVLYTEENAKRLVEAELSIFTKYGYPLEYRSYCEPTST